MSLLLTPPRADARRQLTAALSSPARYIGNAKYNEYNKAALDSVGGKTAGMTMTVSTMQLAVCAA